MNHHPSSHDDQREVPDDLIPIVISLLLTASDILFPNRGCSEIAFAFEGCFGKPQVRVAAITDAEGCINFDHERLLQWEPQSGTKLRDLLETAAEIHLDEHFPDWCDGFGCTGMLSFTIRREFGGTIRVHPRGLARMRKGFGEDPSLSA